MPYSTKPQTTKHNNRSQNRDFNVFVEEYFGGSDVFIYVNGKRNHNIAAISFQVAEQHKPIYGYGSRTFDDLAVGSRIVTGAIRVPVKNTDDSEFGTNWGVKEYADEPRGRMQVPEWVYNYQPEKEDNNVVIENEDIETLSIISKVQEKLSIPTTGFIDEATRKAINDHRLSNGMMLSTLIDNELLSNLGIEGYSYRAKRRIHLYDSPRRIRSIYIIEKDEALVYIADDEKNLLVRAINGMAGYVFAEDVYKS